MKAAVVEKRATHGGTCLNIGCIPSKALLHASEHFEEAGHSLAAFGVVVGPPKLDLKTMMKHKDETVASNVNGVGKIVGPGRIEVAPAQGDKQTIESKNIVIATGSCVTPLPGITIDEK